MLEKIIVKSGRGGGIAATPLSSQTTAKTIADKQITSFEDLGRTVEPGVNFSKADAGVNIRGLSGPRVVTTIDNIPIPFLSNTVRTGASNSNGGGDSFDFSSISTLDIVRGADSSRAGSGALAGSVVLRTLEPEDLIGEEADWGALFKSTYDSKDRSIHGTAAAAKRSGSTSVLFQGGYGRGHETRTHGTVDVTGPQRTEANPSDFDRHNLLFKLRRDLDGSHSIGFTAERFRKDRDTDLKSDQGSTYRIGDYRGFEDTGRDRVSVDYAYEALSNDSFVDAARLSVYWQTLTRRSGVDGERLTAPFGRYGRDNRIENSTFGLTGGVTKTVEIGGLTHAITLDADAAFSGWRQFTAGACPTPSTCPALANQAEIPSVDSRRVGVTLEDRIGVDGGPFALTLGLRFDWYRYAPQDTAEFRANTGFTRFGMPQGQEGMRVSPKLLATYQLTPEIELFAQWSMAFRAPTVDELYSRFFNSGRGFSYAVLGNPALKPETGQGIEVGANLDGDDWGGRVALFHNSYRNFIDRKTLVSTRSYIESQSANIDRVTISGFELNAFRVFDNGFNIHGAVAYAYGENSDTKAVIRSVAPLKGIAGIGYNQERWGADLSLIASAAMKNDNDPKTFDAPGYGIFDLTAWWTPERFSGLKINAGIYNLFDKEYFDALEVRNVDLASSASAPRSFYSEPGRTFKITLTQRF